ncbi:MAG TPA: RecQ family ATP-dependent DNA helicase [Frankiaceae bacterium]|nr:RecQ family ATP-dependent DNA helicase [Frankiaceae bacterium]
MTDTAEQALTCLRRALGAGAWFRPQQAEAIAALVDDHARILVVQRTGWGKSAVYFVATRLLRDRGAGPTLIVSPLLALMRDQVRMATSLGLRAVTINSSNKDDWAEYQQAILDGSADVLLVSPERLNNSTFRKEILEPLAKGTGLLVVDEAHCISDWGHDFRPDYRRIARLLQLLPASLPVLCTTATANDRVVADIKEQLGSELRLFRGSLHRESLRLSARRMPSQAERLAWLAEWLPQVPGSGIVYTLTVHDAERVADWLTRNGIDCAVYAGESEDAHRIETERRLLANDIKAVVATSALGMGYDKPDLAFVVHYQSPDSPIAYYQQVGRAGRALPEARAVLLSGAEDADIWEWFTESAFPAQEDAERLVGLLGDGQPWTVRRLQGEVNVSSGRLLAMLNVLEVEGVVERVGGEYRRSLAPWTYDADRVARVTAQRRVEQQAMRDYVATPGCRMTFLRALLDDADAEPCGRCDNCRGVPLPPPSDRAGIADAAAFLRRRDVSIEPRKKWPGGARDGKIAEDRRLDPGRALSRLGDGGWGDAVLAAKHAHTPFPVDLVAAFVEMIRSWAPQPPPQWVTYVPPSAAERTQVRLLAESVGKLLGLPVLEVVARRRESAPQKLMANSYQQLRNVHDVYEIVPPVPEGPVLLVDDVVDSRWTVTVIGTALRELGSGPVIPVALARTKG